MTDKLRRAIAHGIAVSVMICVAAPVYAGHIPVLTYHYSPLIDGWDQNEPLLNYSNVAGTGAGAKFQLLYTLPLDAYDFAQPLVVPAAIVQGDPNPGTHDVVYVSTYGNTVYAIDPTRGTVLAQRTLDPVGVDPCYPHGPDGINGTPVIDATTKTMYVVDYTTYQGSPAFVVHALNIGTLADRVPPVLVAATQQLTSGVAYAFNASDSRQRAGLVEVAGNIYVGFAASCEGLTQNPARSRGWLLGWNGATLAQLPLTELTDSQGTAPNNFFHSSIWMSGAGLAADRQNNLYFVTGNSDPSGTTYSTQTNISETAAELNVTTGALTSFFTPWNVGFLDKIDLDFGSGGITLLPFVAGQPELAVATGKSGIMYLMQRGNLGGITAAAPDNVLGEYKVGGCWCVASSFLIGTSTYVVSSGGTEIEVWSLQQTPKPNLAMVASTPALPPSSFGPRGYFTTVSSNGANMPIIWTVTRPTVATDPMMLEAFQALPPAGSTTLPLLFSAPAGTWSYPHDPNVTPVVANGYVYVAADHQLSIFGLSNARARR